MAFGTRQRPRVKKANNVQLTIEGVLLQTVRTYQYLGMLLDSTLSNNYHVNTVIGTVTYKSNLLAKIRKYLTKDVALKIYKSMILTYFDYVDVIYNSANKEGLDKLQRLQNKCLKICMGFNNRHGTKYLHTVAKMPMLEARRAAHVSNFMHHRLDKAHLRDNRDLPTRAHDAQMFRVDKPSIEAYKRSVAFAGSSRWNNLPTAIRNIRDITKFKQAQAEIMMATIAELHDVD